MVKSRKKLFPQFPVIGLIVMHLPIYELHASVAMKLNLLMDGDFPKTTPISIIPIKPVSHVGLGFITGFVRAADPDVTYAGPSRLPILMARSNPSYGFAVNNEPRFLNYQTFSYTRSNNPGSTIHLVLSDGWDNEKTGWPYANEENRSFWENDFAHKQIINTIGKFGVDNVVIDIFNEPESLFRGYTPPQSEINAFLGTRPVTNLEYYENWKKAVRYIRSLPYPYSNVKIAGPSNSGYSDFINEFLTAAHADAVLPDIVNWHELDYESIFDLDMNVSKVRAHMSNWNLTRPIGINEYMGKTETYSPGIALGFFSKLEKADVADAGKSCWWRDDEDNECDIGSYCGLYSQVGNTFYPRSIWWAYRWYADASGYLLAEPPLRPHEAFFGSYDSAKRRLQLIFTNTSRADDPLAIGNIIGPRILDFSLMPTELFGACRVTLERIKPGERSVYAAPEVVRDEILNVDSDLTLLKPKIEPEHVYRFVLEKL